MPEFPRFFRTFVAIPFVAAVGIVAVPRSAAADAPAAAGAPAAPATGAAAPAADDGSSKVFVLPDTGVKPGTPGPNEDVVAVDSNGDGKPDLFKYYAKGKVPTDPNKPDSGGPILRKETDLNGDGKIDVWTWYNSDGSKRWEAFDLDFDNHIDLVVYYEKSIVIRKELYSTGKNKPDVFKFYEKGKLVRVERDRRGSGHIDTWEYWDGDQIDRIGEDNNGDGNIDRWIKPTKKT